VLTVAARIIVDEMRKLHIYDIPGEDVKVLTNTLFEYSRRLEQLAGENGLGQKSPWGLRKSWVLEVQKISCLQTLVTQQITKMKW